MNPLKHFFKTIVQLLKQACLFPEVLARTAKRRRQQIEFDKKEVERLDRIRNPEKYRGK